MGSIETDSKKNGSYRKQQWKPLFFKQFARYPSLYVLGAFPAWLKVLSRNFGAVLLKKSKNVRGSVPLRALAMRQNWPALSKCPKSSQVIYESKM